MKLGIFDSGLGGLVITKAIRQRMSDIDILYFGDTLHLPYGNRSDEAIYMYTQRAMNYMFEQNCALIVIACNTASATALRRLQQTWLPQAWPGRNIIGVVVPTLEAAIEKGHKKLGLIATHYSIKSNAYAQELQKIDPSIELVQTATPLLVPLIENDGLKYVDSVLCDYLNPMVRQGIECLVLGCTHYPFLKPQIQNVIGSNIELLSQDDIIPGKLSDYLVRHPEYEISRHGKTEFIVSDLTDNYVKAAEGLYGSRLSIAKMAA
jgi:glutamate racemase